MATQGMVSLVKGGAVIMKVITGSDGYNAPKLAEWLRHNHSASPREVYDKALSLNFGGECNLVVQHSPFDYIVDDGWIEDLPKIYSDKFGDPEFNQRWDIGIVDHLEVIRL